MSRLGGHRRDRGTRDPVVLVFGESENDRRAIKHLVRGLRSDLRVEERRAPLVLIKGALPTTARSNAEKIASVVRQEGGPVLAVLAHQDCDDLEPAHEAAAASIEAALSTAGCPGPIGVTPAWEMEAWWMVFPEAVGKIVTGWRDPDDWIGRDVGLVRHAKEELKKAVQPRPRRASPPRDYEERDSIDVARNIADDGLIGSFDADHRATPHPSGGRKLTRSRSFERFRKRVLGIGAAR